MTALRRLSFALKALRQLGPRPLALYAWYRIGLRSGWLRWQTNERRTVGETGVLSPVLLLPPRDELAAVLGKDGVAHLMAEADEIAAGQVRLFGGNPRPLDLAPPPPPRHWTACEIRPAADADIKFIWEAARFGWAFSLARAYYLGQEERYAAAFWQAAETFWQNNPPNCGPNWVSAQEVALRLMAFVFAGQVFAPAECSTPARLARLAQSIAAHAARIPSTLAYARAQNNNHLLSEAAGLITAALALPNHPAACRWLAMGCQWFDWALQHQIAADGAYCQHSANYHRLMLQLALWVTALQPPTANRLQAAGKHRLAQATRWLLALLDPSSGHLPNLGPNDGAYILPLTSLPHDDYRPVAQAASLAFLGQAALPGGKWDEMALWLSPGTHKRSGVTLVETTPIASDQPAPTVLRGLNSWAYLRAARFRARPGHADQLHLDLWWRGLNIAQDAGSYLYNAHPPWDNALARTAVHNTVMVDEQEQMTYAGRFLWLDWAQAEAISREKDADGKWERLAAQHDGYRRLGVVHRRVVTTFSDGRWLVEDQLIPVGASHAGEVSHRCRLHWLLPDWPYELQAPGDLLRLASPWGWISLHIGVRAEHLIERRWRLARAGERLCGDGSAAPVEGWTSPTYGTKIPALAWVVEVTARLPVALTSQWHFPS